MKFHRIIPDGSTRGLILEADCIQKIRIRAGMKNKATGWGDLKNRIIGVKNNAF